MTDQSRYEAYKRHDWENDAEWQSYLQNMTVTQSADARKLIEKKRRQWYKKKRDPEFNVAYEPANDAQPTDAQQR